MAPAPAPPEAGAEAPPEAGAEAPPEAGQDPNAATPGSPVGIPQETLLAAGGGAPAAPPTAMSGPGMVAMPDGLHLEIPLPSLHLVIKTADAKVDSLEVERQEALTSFNDLFSDIFRP